MFDQEIHALLVLLGKCQRIIIAQNTAIKGIFRRNKPYPASPQTFGEQLHKKRLDEGLKQADLAQKLEVSKSSIDKWECDKTTPSKRFHLAISSFLESDPFQKKANPTAG